MNLEQLNDKQKEAVLYNEGPLLIIAGAGAGKTKTLTTKIAFLIEEKNVNPRNILAITFTNKAAKEMKDRLYMQIGSLSKELQVSTFHSFGLKLLRENYETLGYDKNFVIMDSDDSLTVVKKILKDANYDPKIYNPKAIRNKISSCKNEMMTPDIYDKYAVSDYEKVIKEVYEKYERKLHMNNSVDFDDLLLLPIQLFKKNPDVLDKYQELYQYILIDEYQDTNEAQYILTKLLSAKNRKITCVGDDSQSIYSFRGANYKNILNFEKDYKDAKVILLEQNYRSTKTILNAANSVIKNNIERKDKNLWTDNENGEKIKYIRAIDEKDEASFVTREIK
ncbi:MAG: UvrD-helicase domain-containing protein, partial [Bacilli bacterium]|nr:UvrD-helicase domain-containing protein [Bacilli bacterium]